MNIQKIIHAFYRMSKISKKYDFNSILKTYEKKDIKLVERYKKRNLKKSKNIFLTYSSSNILPFLITEDNEINKRDQKETKNNEYCFKKEDIDHLVYYNTIQFIYRDIFFFSIEN